MTVRDLNYLNMDKIKNNYKSNDLFNDFLFIFRNKFIFIKKSRKYYLLCTNYKPNEYLYLDSNFYIYKSSLSLNEIIDCFKSEVMHLINEDVPF